MVRLDTLFSKKSTAKSAPAPDTGPSTRPPTAEELDRKALRLERRELLYAVVRESMARVGMLSSSYKYKVLSLDSRGKQYLIMMDLPREMAEHISQLAEIEEVIIQNARQRHHIEVTAVYWRINGLAKVANTVLRKPRTEFEAAVPTAYTAPMTETELVSATTQSPAPIGQRRFEPIRPDEVDAFKQGQGKKPGTSDAKPKFSPSEFPPTDFEETRIDDSSGHMPLSRTQYGDLI